MLFTVIDLIKSDDIPDGWVKCSASSLVRWRPLGSTFVHHLPAMMARLGLPATADGKEFPVQTGNPLQLQSGLQLVRKLELMSFFPAAY